MQSSARACLRTLPLSALALLCMNTTDMRADMAGDAVSGATGTAAKAVTSAVGTAEDAVSSATGTASKALGTVSAATSTTSTEQDGRTSVTRTENPLQAADRKLDDLLTTRKDVGGATVTQKASLQDLPLDLPAKAIGAVTQPQFTSTKDQGNGVTVTKKTYLPLPDTDFFSTTQQQGRATVKKDLSLSDIPAAMGDLVPDVPTYTETQAGGATVTRPVTAPVTNAIGNTVGAVAGFVRSPGYTYTETMAGGTTVTRRWTPASLVSKDTVVDAASTATNTAESAGGSVLGTLNPVNWFKPSGNTSSQPASRSGNRWTDSASRNRQKIVHP